MATSCLSYFDDDIFKALPVVNGGADDVFANTLLDFDTRYEQNEDPLWAAVEYKSLDSTLFGQAAIALAASSVAPAQIEQISISLPPASSQHDHFPSPPQSLGSRDSQLAANLSGSQVLASSEDDTSQFLAAIERRFSRPQTIEQPENQIQLGYPKTSIAPVQSPHTLELAELLSLPPSPPLSNRAPSLPLSSGRSPTAHPKQPRSPHATTTFTASTAQALTAPTAGDRSTIKRAHKKRQRKRRILSAAEQESKRALVLERNRKAASKCRSKRKVFVQELEEALRIAQKSNVEMKAEIESLRSQVAVLRVLLKSCAEERCRARTAGTTLQYT